MADEKPRLGRGLEAIFGENVSTVLDEIQRSHANNSEEVALELIHPNPYQPRIHFDEVKIEELAQSIREHGVFTPILIRKAVSGYQLIAGERRLRAAKVAQLKSIPSIILEFTESEMMEISLIENIQREDLNIIEEAKAYDNLLTRMNMTQETLAKKVGKSRVHITNTLRLLQLPKSVQDLVLNKVLTMGQVKPLITLDDPHKIKTLADKIAKEGLSARDVEKLVKDKKASKKPEVKQTDYSYAERLLTNKFQTKVKIDHRTVTINYQDEDDLNRLLELMGVIED
ncbi:MAG: ParB-like protein [Erysipelotrichaceae bacterium]|nr:MAG: ParB-like [Erysipelotrichaceae bacterium]TXT19604.1 MAG: ParB-like protein [Erysipelotrichaceae bacterium]